jgi:hypothetical protein
MLFLLGIIVGLVAGAIIHVYRTREQREAFNAVCAQNEMLRNREQSLTSQLTVAVVERDQLRIISRKAISARAL